MDGGLKKTPDNVNSFQNPPAQKCTQPMSFSPTIVDIFGQFS